MEIFFSDIPEEGLPISGTLSPKFFDLAEDDAISLSGEIEYAITLYKFEEVIVLSGQVTVPCQLQCVTCLEFFPHEESFEQWNSEFDIEEEMVKFHPLESLRDEILLALPAVPHCDEMNPDRVCPKVQLLEKFEHDGKPLEVAPPPVEEEDNPWSALNELEK